MQASWRRVGDVCVNPGADARATVEDAYAPGAMRYALTERACSLGGEVVTPTGLCSNGKNSAVEFGVFVPR